MNLNKKIGFLLDKGLNPDFISSLNENKINFLFETLSKKKETSEQSTVPQNTIPRTTTTTTYEVKPNSTTLINGVEIDTTGGKTKATPMKEIKDSEELDEKFESKAQQGLFWARCNKCKDKDCKWCKMANEFSKSTSKKQYEKMPEKKHPEKTVKYKKETKEGYLDNVGKKVTDTYAKKLASFKPGLAWGGLKEDYNKIIEKYTQPTMKKRDLLKLIESEIKRKKGLNEDFYFDDSSELGESSYGEPMTLDPMTTFDTETDIETKRELSKVAEVEDCETGQTFYIKPKKSTSPSDIYMISDGGSNYCVQVIKMVKKEPSDFRIIESYSECNDCIIDLKLNKKEGGGKSQFGVETSYGTDTSSDSRPRIKKFGKFTPDVDKHSTIDPDTLRLPKAGRENTSKFTASFRRNLDKINEILNRRNNI
jgi:hypothetical protein